MLQLQLLVPHNVDLSKYAHKGATPERAVWVSHGTDRRIVRVKIFQSKGNSLSSQEVRLGCLLLLPS